MSELETLSAGGGMATEGKPVNLAIVGAGPCGLAAASAARVGGVSATVFDRGFITDSLIHYPPYMTFFSTAEKLEIEDVPFILASGKPTRRDALVYYRRVVRHFALDVRQHEEVTAIEGRRGDFVLRTRRRDGTRAGHRARAVVVATGGFHEPNYLDVPGEDLPKVHHYYREPDPYYDQDVLVVGGRNSAVEAALELFRAHARVTLVHIFDGIDDGVKPWVVPDITNRIKFGEIATHFTTRVAEIRQRSVVLEHLETGVTTELANDWVFAMTGWRASPLLLESVGVRIDEQTGIPSHDRATMETNTPGIYIAGVLAAGHDANKIFIENGRFHGGLIVDHFKATRDG
ncbi:MAG: YpdA family putative bacillithiol disulfide reductase [Gammaproteobacteria bacterium]|nr:YpdA family putative bacillithiol disulfide reductase [Gammaproteobacteria bacterium]